MRQSMLYYPIFNQVIALFIIVYNFLRLSIEVIF